MRKNLGERVTKIIGYGTSIISLIAFFVLLYLGLFVHLNIKIEDVIICLLSSIIFFISANINGKKDSKKGEK